MKVPRRVHTYMNTTTSSYHLSNTVWIFRPEIHIYVFPDTKGGINTNRILYKKHMAFSNTLGFHREIFTL